MRNNNNIHYEHQIITKNNSTQIYKIYEPINVNLQHKINYTTLQTHSYLLPHNKNHKGESWQQSYLTYILYVIE